jgi:N-acetylgalactosamine-6-sulfatase
MNISKSHIITCVVLFLNVLGWCDKQPNIVFIFTDDQGWGDLGAYGHPDAQTPHLDALASNGMLFNQFYVASPVCSPSRASLLTGRFAAETGIHYAMGGPAGNEFNDVLWLDPAIPNIYRVFAENGYRIGHYGKWHLGQRDRDGNDVAPPLKAYGVHESATNKSVPPKLSGLTNSNKSERVADEGVAFIERNRDRPFFLSLWINDPHAILDPTEEQMAPYLELTHPTVRNRMRNSQTVYYAILTAIDAAVGRVIKALDDAELSDDTIVIFSSDNGPSPLWSQATGHAGSGLTGPFRGTKASLYEGGIRVPFIVSWPKHIPAGKVELSSVLSAVDMFPTLAKLAGLDANIPENLDGEDMSEVLLGTPKERSGALFWEYRFGNWGREMMVSPQLAVLEGDWKLLMNPDRSRVELYNISEDLTETENRARYEHETVDRLSAKLLHWWQTEVPSPKKAPPFAGQSQWRMPGSK